MFSKDLIRKMYLFIKKRTEMTSHKSRKNSIAFKKIVDIFSIKYINLICICNVSVKLNLRATNV